MAKIVAVIDIGSNSARMAIFEKTSHFGFFLLEECKSRVRVSEGSYENGGILQEYPMQRTLFALKEFMQRAKQKGARKIFCVATSALRDAPNSSEFLQRAKRECGIQIKIIDGKKEAYYGAISCLNLSHQKSGITIDVGGGSSECALLEEGKILSMASLDIGAIRIKELFFDGKNDVEGARNFIKQELQKLPKDYSHKYALGIGGSIRALSKIIAKERGVAFLHGLEVEAEYYIDFSRKISESHNDMLSEMGFSEDRVDSIKSGALVFCAFLEYFGIKKVITCGVGVREGVFLSDLLRHCGSRFPKGFNPSLKSLLDRFEDKKSRAKEIKKQALQIFDTLSSFHKISEKYKASLAIASRLSLLGERLGCHSQSAHSAYLAFNGLEYGFSYNERSLIKTLIEYSGKKLPKESRFKSLSLKELKMLCSFLSLAKILSYSPRVQYSSPATGVLQIDGAGQLAREQILKVVKNLDFEVAFESKNILSNKLHPRMTF